MDQTLNSILESIGLPYVLEWTGHLARGDGEARVIVHNLWRELLLNHMPRATAESLLSELDTWLSDQGPDESKCKEMIASFCSLCYAAEQDPRTSALDVLQSETVPFFNSDRSPDLTSAAWYYTAMCLATFCFHCWQNTSATTGRRGTARDREVAMSRALDIIRSPRKFRLALESEGLLFSGPFRFFWLADFADDLPRDLDSKGGEAPEWLRAQVGTAHYANDYLAAFEIARSQLSVGASRKPTLFDARGYAYFRPAFRDDGWGIAVDLATKEDGRPEAVHAEVFLHEGVHPIPVGLLPKEAVQYDEADWAELLAVSEQQLLSRGGDHTQ